MTDEFRVRAFHPEKVPRPEGAEWKPFQLPAGFVATTPIDLELGCGVGLHPIRYAQENPNRFIIAIERTREKWASFALRVSHHPEIRNLLPIHADAVNWVTHCLSARQISRCFILYPNPCRQNSSQRWIRMPFLNRLIEVVKDDGEFTMATNIVEYRDEVRVWAPRRGLQIVRERELDVRSVAGARTHFEKKYLLRGEPCFEWVMKKALLGPGSA